MEGKLEIYKLDTLRKLKKQVIILRNIQETHIARLKSHPRRLMINQRQYHQRRKQLSLEMEKISSLRIIKSFQDKDFQRVLIGIRKKIARTLKRVKMKLQTRNNKNDIEDQVNNQTGAVRECIFPEDKGQAS